MLKTQREKAAGLKYALKRQKMKITMETFMKIMLCRHHSGYRAD